MKDGKRGFFVLLVTFIVLALTQTYVTTTDLVVKMYTLVSTYVVIVGTVLYGIGIWMRNKPIHYIGIGITAIGYVYSIVELFTKIPKFSIELGLMIYILSLISFIVSIIMPDTSNRLEINEAEATTTTYENNKVVDNTPSVDYSNDVAFGTYISGIPKRPELSKKMCLLGYKDNKFILYIVNGDKVETFNISYGIVIDITSRQRVVMEQNDVVNEDTTQDRQTLATEVVSVYGNSVADAIVKNIKNTRQNVSYNDMYELTLNFTAMDGFRKLIINVESDPSEFIKKFADVDKSNKEPFVMDTVITEEVKEESNEVPVVDVSTIAQTQEVSAAIKEELNKTEATPMNGELLEEDKNDDVEELI